LTTSKLNSTLVLCHKLRHSIVNIGEEYDGQFTYFRVNAQHSLNNTKWEHWLPWTEADGGGNTLCIECSNMHLQVYPWQILDHKDLLPWFTFYALGMFSRFVIKFSISGAAQKSDLTVFLDGKNLAFTLWKGVRCECWHYEIQSAEEGCSCTLSAGMHELVFHLGSTAPSGQVLICSVEILEFGDESE
jgi:hypothetical protein